MEQWIERLQKKLGRQLKTEEVQFVEWLNQRLEQEYQKVGERYIRLEHTNVPK